MNKRRKRHSLSQALQICRYLDGLPAKDWGLGRRDTACSMVQSITLLHNICPLLDNTWISHYPPSVGLSLIHI